jgi:predicted signal transduction protein with EAL and GGDEF domain
VETQGELDFLKRAGCTEAQGHFFSKAVPAKDVGALLARQGLRPRVSPDGLAILNCVSNRNSAS